MRPISRSIQWPAHKTSIISPYHDTTSSTETADKRQQWATIILKPLPYPRAAAIFASTRRKSGHIRPGNRKRNRQTKKECKYSMWDGSVADAARGERSWWRWSWEPPKSRAGGRTSSSPLAIAIVLLLLFLDSVGIWPRYRLTYAETALRVWEKALALSSASFRSTAVGMCDLNMSMFSLG